MKHKPDKMIDVEIGALVHQRRKEAKLSIRVLSDRLGWHYQAVSLIERGEQALRVRELGQLAEALGVSVLCLLPSNWRGVS